MPRFSKKKQQILQLLHSGNAENIRLGLLLAESQAIDLEDWWRSVEEIWRISQPSEPNTTPPRPQMLQEVQSRTILNWSDNGLRRLPWAMPVLCSVTEFNFKGNPIRDWLAAFQLLQQLPQLRKVRWAGPQYIHWQQHFQGEPQTRLSAGAHETVPCALTPYEGISRQNIQAFFDGLNWLYPQLQILRLTCPPRFEFPNELRFPPHLQELSMSGKLQQLPDSIGLLADLQRLSLPSHRLRLLPHTIGQLSQLHTLMLPYNALLELPESIGGCQALKRLTLQRNYLRHLPASFAQLQQLHWLDLADNPIEWAQAIPILAQLPHLQEILLRATDIAPNELQQLRSVTSARVLIVA